MVTKTFDFVYYIWNEQLVGSIQGESFSVRAVSGGGRGGKHADHCFDSFSPYKTTDDKTNTRGGVIPPGKWRIEKPSDYNGRMKAPAAKLTPLGNQIVDFSMREYTDRPFLIHGPGEKGSDGCIVIERVERKRLLDAIERAGGATLLVTQTTQEGDLLNKSLKLRNTA